MTDSGTATATILFTDVVASTDMRVRSGEHAADVLFRAHARRLSEIVTEHRGRVLKQAGDGIMAAFDAASDAVATAIAIQQDVAANQPEMAVRIGAAAGDVSWEDGDCFGLPVVAAARLADLADGGQILVSQAVHLLAGARAAGTFENLGLHELRGLPDGIELHEVHWEPPPSPTSPDTTGPAVVPLPPALAGAGTAFVGRDAEWKALADGGPCVLIGGEAGAGKTRLAAEYARRRHDEGAAALFGGCDSDLALPYQPWVQAIDHLVRSLGQELSSDQLRPELAELAVVLPVLDRLVPGLRRAARHDAPTDQFLLFEAVAALFRATAARRPVVLLLDDLHWAGPPTLGLLRHVARAAVPGLQIVVTFRDTGDEVTEPLASCLADLRRVEGTTGVRLGGLDEASIERLVSAQVGHDLDDGLRALARAIAERSGGNAFYAGELWQHLVRSGAVVRRGDHWNAVATVSTTGVPDSVKEVVRARLARRTDAARGLIELAAIAGPRVEVRVLGMASGLDDDALAITVDQLVDAGLLREGDEPQYYEFPHALVRDTVVETVTPMARAGMHLRLARAVESYHEADRRPVLARLAWHYAAAVPVSNPAKAVEYARRAAMQARKSAAHDAATAHLETALALVGAGTTDHAALLYDLGTVSLRAGRYVEATQILREAFAEARRLGEHSLAVDAATGFEQAVHMPGLPGDEAVELVGQALELVDSEDAARRARLQASLARAYAHAGRSEDAGPAVALALQMARECGDVETLCAALSAALINEGDPERVLEYAAELEQIAPRSGDPWNELYATSNGLRALVTLGRLDEAAVMLSRHFAVTDSGRWPVFQYVGFGFQVVLSLAAGRFDEAETQAEEAHTLGSEGNTPFDAGVYGLQMFAIRREQGRLDEVAPVLQLVSRLDDDQNLWGPGLAALYADLGMLDEARALLDSMRADRFGALPRDALWPACVSFLADTALALEDLHAAAVVAEEMASFAGLNVMAGMTICFGPADRWLGNLALLLGRPDDAARHLAAAAALAARSGSPVWAARVDHDRARLLAATGRPREAAELGNAARQAALVLGMADLANAPVPGAPTSAASVDAVAVMPVTSQPDHLSAREIEVLRHVAAGRSNREIGEELFISQNTVANHVRSILQKTGCANRAEAAVYAARQDLLDA